MSLYSCLAQRRISAMSTRTVLFLVIFFVLAFVSEQAPPKRPVQDGSGEVPSDVFGNDKNLLKVNPGLADDDSVEYEDAGFNGRRTTTQDYEYKGPADSDYDNRFNKPGISPGFDADDHPFDGRGVNDEDNEIHKNEEDEESGIDKTGDGDDDETQNGEIDQSFDDRNSKIPKGEDEGKFNKGVDEPRDDYPDFVPKDYYDEDYKSDDVPANFPGLRDFYNGLFFNNPFFSVRQVSKYFQQLERALEQVFRQTMDETMLLNGTYANTTEEEVEIDGKTYVVQKSIIKGRDNNSSIYIEALSTVPKTNETKKANDSVDKKSEK